MATLGGGGGMAMLQLSAALPNSHLCGTVMSQDAPAALPRALDVQRFAGAREQEARGPSVPMHDCNWAVDVNAAAAGP